MKATMQATIAHLEIPADDIVRARNFYSELFGWDFEEAAGGDYWLFSMERTKPMGGGMMKRRQPGQLMLNYFEIPSVDQYTEKVKALGGKIITGKTAVPGMGYYCVCVDTEDNAFGLWEENREAR